MFICVLNVIECTCKVLKDGLFIKKNGIQSSDNSKHLPMAFRFFKINITTVFENC